MCTFSSVSFLVSKHMLLYWQWFAPSIWAQIEKCAHISEMHRSVRYRFNQCMGRCVWHMCRSAECITTNVVGLFLFWKKKFLVLWRRKRRRRKKPEHTVVHWAFDVFCAGYSNGMLQKSQWKKCFGKQETVTARCRTATRFFLQHILHDFIHLLVQLLLLLFF